VHFSFDGRRESGVLTYLILAATVSAGDAAAVDFDTQVIPILTRAGCNSGACHGSAAGRAGFKLSLYGGDPAADHEAIALELEGRRINLRSPHDSLVVLKPTGWLEHGGGDPLDADGPGAALLRQWINEGAERQAGRKLTHLELTPLRQVLSQPGETVSLRATARFNDGPPEDVTRWTVFTAEDAAAIEIDDSARAIVHRHGRHLVIARFLDRVVPLELIVPLSEQPVDLASAPRGNFIDESVYEQLQTLRLPVSPPAIDATFVRRVQLDLSGRLPTIDDALQFQADRSPDKRSQLVHRLLQSEAFTTYWTYKLGELLRIRPRSPEGEDARAYQTWLRQQLAGGTPYNQFARDLITAAGDTWEHGPANFYMTTGDARSQAEFISELFLGVRLRCANCHNHPLDRWTQDDYHGLAAIFAGIERGRVIKDTGKGEVVHPRTGEAAVRRIPGEHFLTDGGDSRAALADWIVGNDNPYFAKAIVNRLWKSLMGRGLVEPTDDLRATNPATHPELLDQLAADFVEHGYDLRHTIGRICDSAAYARSSLPVDGNADDDRYYSHALVRPLEPEVLLDALADVTGVPEQFGDEPFGTRAIALVNSQAPSEALDVLGRCSRAESCEAPAGSAVSGGLTLKLQQLNGELLNARLANPDGRLARMLKDHPSGESLVQEFYLTALSRRPTDDETAYWTRHFAAADFGEGFRATAEDFVWALLTCREFVTNH
jgi:hypothetical protein